MEAASSCSTGKASSGSRDKRPRLMPGSLDVESGPGLTIHQLDGVALVEIFGNLEIEDKASVAKVCKIWRELVYGCALWKDTVAHLDAGSLSSADLESLKKRGIRKVVITRLTSRDNVKTLVNALPLLELLDITCLPLTGLADVFPEPLPRLKHLKITLNRLDSGQVTSIGRTFPHITFLWVEARCSGDLLFHISILKNLKELHLLTSGPRMLASDLPDIPEQPVEMSCLTDLSLLTMDLGDQMLHYLRRICPKLQQLTVIPCDDVTDDAMQQLVQMKDLQVLELLVNSTTPLSTALIAKLENVCALYIGSAYVGDEQLDALAQLYKLQELRISCTNISEEGWRALGWGFKELRCLALYQFDCSVPTAVEHLASLPSLEKIEFCTLEATDDEMMSLCLALNHVHSMTINDGPKKAHHYMQHIAKMENLKELQLISTWIGDIQLQKLADGKASLESLTLDKCGIRGKGLLCIAQRKKSLRKLEVCRQMNENILSRIVKELPGLQELTTKLCANTRRGLRRLKPGLIVW